MSTLTSQLVSLIATRRQIASKRRSFASWLRDWFQRQSGIQINEVASRTPRRLGRSFSSSFEQLEARAMMAVLNELKVNPPGSAAGSDKYQYIELAGAVNESLANHYMVMFDGNGSAAGTASYVANLGSRVLGSNGLLMIKSPTGGHAAGSGTTVVTDTQFDNGAGLLNKNTVSFVLASANAAFVQGTDYDTNNDGTLDNLPAGFTLVDSVGWSDGDAGDRVYGNVSLTQTQGTPDGATRIVGNTSTSSSAWYNADLYDVGNDATQLLFDKDRASSNLPVNPFIASMTPGAANFEASTTTRALRMVSYNITSSGNSGIPQTGLSTILQGIGSEIVSAISRPIDLLSIQEILSQATTSVTVAGLLNTAYGSLATYAASVMNGGTTGAGTQGFVYNTQTLSLVGEALIGTTSVSGQPRQTNRAQFRPAGTTGSSDFYVYNSHWKSADSSGDEARRLVEAQAIRANADALGQGANILYVGDFNVYRSSDDGFQALIAAGNGQAFDPINRIGSWSGNSSFVDVFTQAPAQSPPNDLTGGGLDDRFDFQLVSGELLDGQGLEYRTGSYRAFGNNGSVPLDGDINSTSSTALPGLSNRSTILNLLVSVTDHLPVVADFTYTVAATSNQAPSGTNKTVSTSEDTQYTYTVSDFGFSDSSHALLAVRVATLPTAGSLLLNNVAVSAGQFIAVADISAGNLKFAPVANANGNPYSTWTFQVQDNGGTANGGVDLDPTPNTITVNVSAVNDAPATSTTGGSAAFTGTAIIVDSGITVSDIDSVNLAGATISFTSNFTSSQDVLGFVNANGITGSYNASTGVLSLSGSASVANYQAALRSVTYNNTNASPNTTTRVVSFQVNDGGAANNLSNVATKSVTVVNSGSQPVSVSSVTPASTGFTIQFSRPIDPAQINLYDATTNSLGVTDVTLTGTASGVVRGSVVFNSTNNAFTFIKTGMGALAPDTYTLTLRSAANGFVDLGGNLLRDVGGVNAGNYVSTFIVSAPANNAVTLSIPDFARGFSQTVNVPNTSTGLPIIISNANNIGGVDVTINYNPALLTITGVSTPIAGASAVINNSVPGVARIQVASPDAFAVVDGAATILNLIASVPANAPYASKGIISFASSLVRNTNLDVVPSVADNAVHVAAFFDDLNADQGYDSADTILVQRLGVLLNSGATSYQTLDPYVIGDALNDQSFDSADTITAQRLGVSIPVPSVPALPPGAGSHVIYGADPRLSIGTVTASSAAVGTNVFVPINLLVTEANGITLAGMDFAVSFDPNRFQVTAGGVTIASSTQGGLIWETDANGNSNPNLVGGAFSLAPSNIDNVAGTIRMQASSPDGTGLLPLNTSGALLRIRFTVKAGATAGTSSINLMQNVGTSFTRLRDNNLVALTLVPAPTNASTDTIDGSITIPGAANSAPTALSLSGSTLPENAGVNATVGTFTTTDPNAGDTFTYTLVSGTGSTDNASFNVSGNSLRANASFDFETKNSYAVRVRTTDQGGLFFENTFTINVTNVNEFLSSVSLGTVTASSAAVGTNVFVPINLLVTESSGITLAGMDFAISFDPNQFQVTAGGVTIASSTQNGLIWETDANGNSNPNLVGGAFSLAPSNIDNVAGTIRMQASSPDGTVLLPQGTSGALLRIRFTIKAGATAGTSSINLMQNIGTSNTRLRDNNLVALTLVPAPTNGSTDTIDGSITIPGALPTLSSTVINQGAGFARNNQRSQVVSLTVSFSAPVTLGDNAFSLRNSDTSFVIASSQLIYTRGTASSFVITFGAGSGVTSRVGGTNGLSNGNSLDDGNYELTVDPTKVAGDNVFGDNFGTDNFFRLFGDADGTGIVDGLDNALLRQALKSGNASAVAVFDVDGNSILNSADTIAFGANFNKRRRRF